MYRYDLYKYHLYTVIISLLLIYYLFNILFHSYYELFTVMITELWLPEMKWIYSCSEKKRSVRSEMNKERNGAARNQFFFFHQLSGSNAAAKLIEKKRELPAAEWIVFMNAMKWKQRANAITGVSFIPFSQFFPSFLSLHTALFQIILISHSIAGVSRISFHN